MSDAIHREMGNGRADASWKYVESWPIFHSMMITCFSEACIRSNSLRSGCNNDVCATRAGHYNTVVEPSVREIGEVWCVDRFIPSKIAKDPVIRKKLISDLPWQVSVEHKEIVIQLFLCITVTHKKYLPRDLNIVIINKPHTLLFISGYNVLYQFLSDVMFQIIS